MRKIEKKMLEAINQNREYTESNTTVIVNRNGVFVRLYNAFIYGKVKGREFFADGGYKTATTASRLRALGADYSTNEKRNNCPLKTQRQMLSLYDSGRIGGKC